MSTAIEVLEPYVERCRAAAVSDDPRRAVIAVLESFLADRERHAVLPIPDPEAGHPITGYDETLFEDDSVTVIVVHTRPGFDQPAHDHQIDALIATYAGAEIHRFFRRTGNDAAIAPAGTRRLGVDDGVLALTPDAVHAISAADGAWTRALHVYLGGLTNVRRSIFHPETLAEQPLSLGRYVAWCRPSPS